MSDLRFAVVPVQGMFDSITTQRATDVESVVVASTTAAMTPLELYMHLGSQLSLDSVVASPPSVMEVVRLAMSRPGVAAHDRAVELLGRMSGQTLSLVIQGMVSTDYVMRPVYADKAWEMLTSALSQSDDAHEPHILTFFRKLRSDPNPVKRLAAIDALDMLEA